MIMLLLSLLLFIFLFVYYLIRAWDDDLSQHPSIHPYTGHSIWTICFCFVLFIHSFLSVCHTFLRFVFFLLLLYLYVIFVRSKEKTKASYELSLLTNKYSTEPSTCICTLWWLSPSTTSITNHPTVCPSILSIHTKRLRDSFGFFFSIFFFFFFFCLVFRGANFLMVFMSFFFVSVC